MHKSTRSAGVTLVEVLVAIFITGVGMLALLTLFPLGALDMARAIKDDRTAAVAKRAQAFSQSGEELLSETAEFVAASLSTMSVDPKIAAHLREEYEDLAAEAADMEIQLHRLESVFPRPQVQRYVAPLLAQIRVIRMRIDKMISLLWLLKNG